MKQNKNVNGRVKCQICNEFKKPNEMLPADIVRESVVNTIKKKHPKWSPDGFICHHDLNKFRIEHVQDVLEMEKGELSHLESEVLKSLKEHEIFSKNFNVELKKKLKLAEKLTDKMTEFIGSWTFMVIFTMIIIAWVFVNSHLLVFRPFDPYPFILLNLFLSCIAALQGPIILMSHKRQAEKDSLRAEHDYKTDLKAELEIRHLNSKVDQLISHQWQRLLEIQRIQMELMESSLQKKK